MRDAYFRQSTTSVTFGALEAMGCDAVMATATGDRQDRTATEPVHVLIASPFAAEHVERIAAVDPRIRPLYAPDLLPAPRYVADHVGIRRELGPADEARWRSLLARADVSLDFDWLDVAAMPSNAPRLRWVQATSAGIGQLMERTGLARSDFTVTTAAGTHAVPLAEFALLGALHFIKGVPSLRERQAAHHWERYTTSQLAGRRAVVVGLGGIGRRIVSTFAALGVEVVGVGRAGASYDLPGLAGVVASADIDSVLPTADVLVLACPLTEATRGLIGKHQLGLLPAGAVLVNVSRGQVVDEPALVQCLQDGSLAGAALDVFAVEPLPADSPLWDLPNVLVSPHSASTVAVEDDLLVDLFCVNLRRWLDGEDLLNRYRADRGY